MSDSLYPGRRPTAKEVWRDKQSLQQIVIYLLVILFAILFMRNCGTNPCEGLRGRALDRCIEQGWEDYPEPEGML